MKIHVPLLVSLLTAVQWSAGAALVFENSEVALHPTISDQTAVAHFKYKNTGDKPVKITHVQPSCGCTTAALAKDVVAPGESGEIVATFNIGQRSGEQTKTIHVTTDEQGGDTILKLKATIPQLLEVSPAFIYWRPGEDPKPKTINVKLGGDFPVTKLDVTPTDPAVKVESARVPNEKAFRITVTPPGGNRPINASLKIVPDFPKDPVKTYYANVRVDAPHSAATKPGAAPASPAPPVTTFGAANQGGPSQVVFGSGTPGVNPNASPGAASTPFMAPPSHRSDPAATPAPQASATPPQ